MIKKRLALFLVFHVTFVLGMENFSKIKALSPDEKKEIEKILKTKSLSPANKKEIETILKKESLSLFDKIVLEILTKEAPKNQNHTPGPIPLEELINTTPPKESLPKTQKSAKAQKEPQKHTSENKGDTIKKPLLDAIAERACYGKCLETIELLAVLKSKNDQYRRDRRQNLSPEEIKKFNAAAVEAYKYLQAGKPLKNGNDVMMLDNPIEQEFLHAFLEGSLPQIGQDF